MGQTIESCKWIWFPYINLHFRGVARFATLSGQERNISSVSPYSPIIFWFFLNFSSFSSSMWFSKWAVQYTLWDMHLFPPVNSPFSSFLQASKLQEHSMRHAYTKSVPQEHEMCVKHFTRFMPTCSQNCQLSQTATKHRHCKLCGGAHTDPVSSLHVLY